MRLNVKFKEGANHAWLMTEDAAELFIKRPLEAFTTLAGALVCQVPSEIMEEIRDANELVETMDPDPASVFVACSTPDDTKLYYVTESVTYAGGDCLLFIRPMATFH